LPRAGDILERTSECLFLSFRVPVFISQYYTASTGFLVWLVFLFVWWYCDLNWAALAACKAGATALTSRRQPFLLYALFQQCVSLYALAGLLRVSAGRLGFCLGFLCPEFTRDVDVMLFPLSYLYLISGSQIDLE
jgi:hypothetical protein